MKPNGALPRITEEETVPDKEYFSKPYEYFIHGDTARDCIVSTQDGQVYISVHMQGIPDKEGVEGGYLVSSMLISKRDAELLRDRLTEAIKSMEAQKDG
jgi:hypothetical protein